MATNRRICCCFVCLSVLWESCLLTATALVDSIMQNVSRTIQLELCQQCTQHGAVDRRNQVGLGTCSRWTSRTQMIAVFACREALLCVSEQLLFYG